MTSVAEVSAGSSFGAGDGATADAMVCDIGRKWCYRAGMRVSREVASAFKSRHVNHQKF